MALSMNRFGRCHTCAFGSMWSPFQHNAPCENCSRAANGPCLVLSSFTNGRSRMRGHRMALLVRCFRTRRLPVKGRRFSVETSTQKWPNRRRRTDQIASDDRSEFAVESVAIVTTCASFSEIWLYCPFCALHRGHISKSVNARLFPSLQKHADAVTGRPVPGHFTIVTGVHCQSVVLTVPFQTCRCARAAQK
jgi:hypothetical protein